VDVDLQLRAAIYRHFADYARAPTIGEMADATSRTSADVRDGYRRLYAKRMLVLMPDGESIRMAPPFSGIETQHQVRAGEKTYFANCAWDSFGIPAALHVEADVLSRCEQTHEPLRLHLTVDGPPSADWLFHAAVPAVRWWRDIVYT
jgi:Alkylmercury lyase